MKLQPQGDLPHMMLLCKLGKMSLLWGVQPRPRTHSLGSGAGFSSSSGVLPWQDTHYLENLCIHPSSPGSMAWASKNKIFAG